MKNHELKRIIKEKMSVLIPGIDEDNVGIKGGRVYVRRSYFYRHGASAERFAAKIQEMLGDSFVCVGEDHWAAHPKMSYFYCFISLSKSAELSLDPMSKLSIEGYVTNGLKQNYFTELQWKALEAVYGHRRKPIEEPKHDFYCPHCGHMEKMPNGRCLKCMKDPNATYFTSTDMTTVSTMEMTVVDEKQKQYDEARQQGCDSYESYAQKYFSKKMLLTQVDWIQYSEKNSQEPKDLTSMQWHVACDIFRSAMRDAINNAKQSGLAEFEIARLILECKPV